LVEVRHDVFRAFLIRVWGGGRREDGGERSNGKEEGEGGRGEHISVDDSFGIGIYLPLNN
jgi:hypothetical protein